RSCSRSNFASDARRFLIGCVISLPIGFVFWFCFLVLFFERASALTCHQLHHSPPYPPPCCRAAVPPGSRRGARSGGAPAGHAAALSAQLRPDTRARPLPGTPAFPRERRSRGRRRASQRQATAPTRARSRAKPHSREIFRQARAQSERPCADHRVR